MEKTTRDPRKFSPNIGPYTTQLPTITQYYSPEMNQNIVVQNKYIMQSKSAEIGSILLRTELLIFNKVIH
jgi:hypothetical protein